MGYKIEYTPEYTRIKLSDNRVKISTLLLAFFVGLLIAGTVLFGREETINALMTIDNVAARFKQGDSVAEVFGSFSQIMQGVFRG